MMRKVKLTDVCDILYGYPFDSSKFNSNNGVGVVRIRDIVRGYTETFTTEDCSQQYAIKKGDILVGMDGEFHIAKWQGALAMLNQRVCKLSPKAALDKNYLFYQMPSILKNIEARTSFVTVKHLSAKELNNVYLYLPSIEEQRKIALALDTVDLLIEKYHAQLQDLKILVKSRFIELFGDPIINPYGYDKVALEELADIKIGPFGSLLHKEDYIEGCHPVINPSHIHEGNIIPDNKLTISEEKFDELKAYHLFKGDVVLGRRGEMGRCAVVNEDGLLCGTGSLLIRPKEYATADFIQKVISFPTFKKTIEDMAVGQTMPNLNVPIVSQFQVIKPPIDVQNKYYDFVAQVDKSKLAIQKSLNDLETLKKSLMQQYFG